MTALQTAAPAATEAVRFLGNQADRATFVDSAVEMTRQAASPAAVEQREVARMSVRELNAMDTQTLQERFERIPRDTRSNVTRFLDLIDLPRNAIVQTVAAAIVPEQRNKLRDANVRGTFGLPRVMFSDVLNGLGVENRIVRAVGGFVGDVAFDPLTYVGPAGWGAKVTTATGRTVHIGARGTRAIKKGINAASREGLDAVKSPEVRELLKAAGASESYIDTLRKQSLEKARAGRLFDGETLSRLQELERRSAAGETLNEVEKASLARLKAEGARQMANPERAARLEVNTVLQQKVSGRTNRSTLSKMNRAIGGDTLLGDSGTSLIGRRGDLEDMVDGVGDVVDIAGQEVRRGMDLRNVSGPARAVDEAAQAAVERKAVRGFLERYGIASRPGIRLGGGGAQVLHIPFTEVGLNVPAFTGAGRRAEAARAIAAVPVAQSPDIAEAVSAIQDFSKLDEEIQAFQEAADELGAIDTEMSRLAEEAGELEAAGALDDPFDFGDEALEQMTAHREQVMERLVARREAATELADSIAARIAALDPENVERVMTPTEAAGVAKVGQMAKILKAQAQLSYAEAAGRFTQADRAVRRAVNDDTARVVGELYRQQSRGGTRVARGVFEGDPGDLKIPAEFASDIERRAYLDGVEDALSDRPRRQFEEAEVQQDLEWDAFNNQAIPTGSAVDPATAARRGAYEQGYTKAQKSLEGDDIGRGLEADDAMAIEQPFGSAFAYRVFERAFPGMLNPGHAGKSVRLSVDDMVAQVAGVSMITEPGTGRLIDDEPQNPVMRLVALAILEHRAGALGNRRGALKGLDTARLDVGDTFKIGERDLVVSGASRNSVVIDIMGQNIDGSAMVVRSVEIPRGKKIPASRGTLRIEGELPDGLEVAQAAVRARRAASLDESRQAAARLSDEAFRSNSDDIPDLLASKAALLLQTANIMDASVLEVARRTKDAKLLNVARVLSGNDDEVAGLSLMAPMKWATSKLEPVDNGASLRMVERLDESIAALFGTRGSVAGERTTRAINAATDTARQRGDRVASQIIRDVRAVLPKDKGEAVLDDALELMTLLAVQKHGKSGALWATGVRLDPETGRLVDGEFIGEAVIRKARDAGLMQPEVLREIDKLADEYGIAMLNDLGEVAQSEGLLTALIPGYIPLQPTAEAADAIRARADRARRTGSQDVANVPKERFQKHRGTHLYKFKDAKGNDHAFYEFELLYENAPKDVLEDLPDITKKRGEAAKASIKEWRKMLEREGLTPAEAAAKYGKPSDPFTLNALASEGAFTYLLGRDGPQFMEQNIALLLRNRFASQARAESVARFHALMREYGVDASTEYVNRLSHTSGSNTIRLANGATAKVYQEGDRMILEIAGERYRRLDLPENALNLLGPEQGGVADLRRFYPVRVAQQIERFHETLTNPRTQNLVWQTSEQLTSLWKRTTLTHPSWIAMNIMGSVALMLQSGSDVPDVVKNFAELRRKIGFLREQQDTAKLADTILNIGGQRMSAIEFLSLAEDNGVVQGLFGETLAQMHARGLITLPSSTRQHFGRAKQEYADQLRKMAQGVNAAGVADRVPSAAGKAAVGAASGTLALGDTLVRRLWNGYFRANARFEDTIRMALFASELSKGQDPAAAAMRVREVLYDYSDFTRSEDFAKRYLIPFYSWFRNNTAYQARQLIENPSSIAAVPKLREAIEEAIAGEEQVPLHQRPRWMLDQLAIQMGRDPNARWAFMAATALPQGDAIALGSILAGAAGGRPLPASQDLARYFGAQLNPVVRVPIEQAAGREIFSGRTIGTDGGDLTVQEHLLGQIRPFRELGIGSVRRGPLQSAFQDGPAALAGRLTLGGRVQDFGADRLDSAIRRQFRDELAELSKQLATIRYNIDDPNDLEATRAVRLRMLDVYRRMMLAGVHDDVPKHVQETLGGLGV